MGEAPGLLGLGHWPSGAIHGPVLVGFVASIWTHLEDRPKPKNHNEFVLVGSVDAWVPRFSTARYCLGEYRCLTFFWVVGTSSKAISIVPNGEST